MTSAYSSTFLPHIMKQLLLMQQLQICHLIGVFRMHFEHSSQLAISSFSNSINPQIPNANLPDFHAYSIATTPHFTTILRLYVYQSILQFHTRSSIPHSHFYRDPFAFIFPNSKDRFYDHSVLPFFALSLLDFTDPYLIRQQQFQAQPYNLYSIVGSIFFPYRPKYGSCFLRDSFTLPFGDTTIDSLQIDTFGFTSTICFREKARYNLRPSKSATAPFPGQQIRPCH